MTATATRSKVKSKSLDEQYGSVRAHSETICRHLETEDYVVQPMADVSPPKWHLGHTTWFWETFILQPHAPGYRIFHDDFSFVFNSYYETVGRRVLRTDRGNLSRPTVAEVYRYRQYVDEGMRRFLSQTEPTPELTTLIELGLNHEQQHQELLVTDIKHVFWTNPMRPAYRPNTRRSSVGATQGWTTIAAGVQEIGYTGSAFHFDNEGPAHKQYVQHAALAHRLTTNAEYGEFIADGGYRRTDLWLSHGWATVQEFGWKAPLYWESVDGAWQEFTLAGMGPLDAQAPVTHISYYEADAFARWSGMRLPTEAEWEVIAREEPVTGRCVEAEFFHPRSEGGTGMQQLFGDVWQWTQSPYVAYPGFHPTAGALGEYNGKWMSDQWVLRGASCATPGSHLRLTYRNFFPSDARWQFTGIRLAQDLT